MHFLDGYLKKINSLFCGVGLENGRTKETGSITFWSTKFFYHAEYILLEYIFKKSESFNFLIAF